MSDIVNNKFIDMEDLKFVMTLLMTDDKNNKEELLSLIDEINDDSKEIELISNGEYIQWKHVGEDDWINLVALSELKGVDGIDGREVIIRVNSGYLQWSYLGSVEWENIISLEELKGENGSNGEDGIDGREVELSKDSESILWRYVGSTTWDVLIPISELVSENIDWENIQNKPVIPNKTSQLTNDSNFVTIGTSDLVNYYLKEDIYTKDEVNTAIEGLSGLDFKIIEEFPTENISTSTIYLKLRDSLSENNVYDEYLYIGDNWEKIGTTEANIDQILEEISDIEVRLDNIESVENVEVWKSGNLYKVGEFVVYDEWMFKCVVSPQEDLTVFNEDEWVMVGSSVVYKEISNPLTNTEISQESPVGEIIRYTGLMPPNHYLPLDGSEHNIVDYPYLSNHFLVNLGSYNYFGGDGINTFKVPNVLGTEVDITPQMTSNTIPTPYVTSASSIYGASYEPWKAFNSIYNQPEDCWATRAGTTDGWIKFDFGTKTRVSAFSIHAMSTINYLPNSPKTFSFDGSDDGTTFTTIRSFTNQTGWSVLEGRTYQLGGAVNYRYYRLSISENNGGTYTAVAELRFKKASSVECIKYEPTYYAVNQYGGFESKVLFNGNANNTGEFSLLDNLEDYDFLLIEHNFSNPIDNEFNIMQLNNTINTSSVVYDKTKQYMYNVDAERRLLYSFSSNNLIRIDEIIVPLNNSIQITKIVGIKGQLPTLLQGGILQ